MAGMEKNQNPNSDNSNEFINLTEIFAVLWNSKVLIISATAIFSMLAIVFSLSLPNIYKSESILSPVAESSDMDSAMRRYSGLANIVGIDIPTQSNAGNAIKALKKLDTLSFFSNNILPNIFLPDLMAIELWESSSNELIYDNDIYDNEKQTWVRDFKYPQTQVPSAQESYKVFIKDHLEVYEDKDSGFVSIAIKHQSPYIAKQWVQLIVNELNNFYRIKDKTEAQAAREFLTNKIAETSIAEIKQAIAMLIQQKTQQLSVIEVNKFYVYEYIDPPEVMERKHEPSRAIICILGTLLGATLGVLIVFIRFYILEGRETEN